MLKAQNLSVSYGKKMVLNDISFSVKSQEIVSILGANGSGKSTLLKSICGSLPYEGEITVDSQNVKRLSAKERAKVFALVPQHNFAPFSFLAFDMALMGRFHRSPLSLDYSKADKDAASAALETVGAIGFKNRIFNTLSGGERQLVIIARALAQEAKIIVLDEPATGLDIGAQQRILTLLENLRSQGKTIIQTTHNPDHALNVGDYVLWIDGSKAIAFGKPLEIITSERIKSIYGVKSELHKHACGKTFLLTIESIDASRSDRAYK
ncbi:MAG: ABC transporter ATP-binding protein [Helicobacteraceae bacterium]|jgi:iron complex transport system ATP-binding protein|nr:ABC transporter ATP-binding protein [Helicobacteraceae bacterium]